jgi:hypothetical protein
MDGAIVAYKGSEIVGYVFVNKELRTRLKPPGTHTWLNIGYVSVSSDIGAESRDISRALIDKAIQSREPGDNVYLECIQKSGSLFEYYKTFGFRPFTASYYDSYFKAGAGTVHMSIDVTGLPEGKKLDYFNMRNGTTVDENKTKSNFVASHFKNFDAIMELRSKISGSVVLDRALYDMLGFSEVEARKFHKILKAKTAFVW